MPLSLFDWTHLAALAAMLLAAMWHDTATRRIPNTLVLWGGLTAIGLSLSPHGIGLGSGQGWMHAKLLIVLALLGYHHSCGVLLRKFESGQMQRSHVWFRWFNEVPVLMMVAAVILVVVKPF